MVCECHQSRDIDVEYISGIINTIKMFTKEMKENTNFINLRGSMMVWLQAFLKYNHNISSHIISAGGILPYYSIFGTHSPRQSRNKIKRYRTHHSKYSGTPIGSQIDRIKWSYLHFYQQGGTDGSQVKWIPTQASVRHPLPIRHLLLITVEKNFPHFYKNIE